MRIQNLSTIRKQIKQYGDAKRQQAKKGVIKVALFVQRESQIIVPVDTGNLRASAGIRIDPSNRPRASVVYTAAYSVFVHEITRYRHAEGKTSKFLVKAVRRNMTKIRQIFNKEMMK